MYFRVRMNRNQNIVYFIAQKLQQRNKVTEESVTGIKRAAKPIKRIAVFSIAIATIVNIITIAVVEGFQQEVSHKVIGFGSHISIQKTGELSLRESDPLQRDPDFESLVRAVKGVTGLYSVAYKPALLQSRSKTEQKEILGVMLKGVDKSYNWSLFKPYLKQGSLPKFAEDNSNEILISQRIASDLHYKVGDTLNAYFVKQKPIQRQFRITGIYETGLEEFDKELCFCYLPQIQQLNDWGISAEIVVDDTLSYGELIIRAVVNGGNGNYRYDWGKGWENYAGFTICPTKDTVFKVIVADYYNFIDEATGVTDRNKGETAIPDTAYLELKISGNKMAVCRFKLNESDEISKQYNDDTGLNYSIDAGDKILNLNSFPGKGSYQNYVGSYEVTLNDFAQLEAIKKSVKKAVERNPNLNEQVKVSSIKELQQDIFVWLSFLDVNLAIVLILMLVIGIVNMGSALLVIILVRSNFIGIMKAMGATNDLLRKVFLAHIGSMILKGMFWGNLLGLGLALIQKYGQIIQLDPKVYYISAVPIEISIWKWLALNVITLTVCLLAMIIPSFIIARISPAKTIRFK